METAATPPQQPVDAEAIAGQQAHWASTFDANPDMYGTNPSAPALAAAKAFAAAGYHSVLELGGFIVHFFDRALICHLAVGFELIDVTDFTEGELPRRLARVTMRVPQR